MKKTNIKFQTEFYAHKIEIIVSSISASEAIPFINENTLSADQLSSVIDQLSGGDKGGYFETYTHILLPEFNPQKETLVKVSGAWRIVPNYRDIHRIRMWHYNFSCTDSEQLTKADFNECFRYNGHHYWEKYTSTYNCNIWEFLGYLGNHILEGEDFLTLCMKKVEAYEKRQADIGYPVRY